MTTVKLLLPVNKNWLTLKTLVLNIKKGGNVWGFCCCCFGVLFVLLGFVVFFPPSSPIPQKALSTSSSTSLSGKCLAFNIF